MLAFSFNIVVVLICMNIASGRLCAQTTNQTADVLKGHNIAAKIQAVLEISAGKGDYLVDLEHVFKSRPKDLSSSTVELDKLVSSVLQGADPEMFSSILTGQATIKGITKDDRYGSAGDRLDLVKLLWESAKVQKDKEPDRAKKYARTALLLAGYEDFIFGRVMLSVVYNDPATFNKIAGLSDEQIRVLSDLLSSVINDHARYNAFLKYSDVEASLIEDPKQDIPVAKLNEAIAILDAEFSAVTSMGDKYQTIIDAWMLRNLVYDRKNKSGEEQVDKMLNAWLQSAGEGPVRRWLAEATSSLGEPFVRSRIIGPAAKKAAQ